ncbi:MAG: outer membrane protein assembly factor BamB, partial [Gammaproteobacteria bacterium]
MSTIKAHASLALLFLVSSCCADGMLIVTSEVSAAATWPQLRGRGGLAVAGDTPILTDIGPEKHVLWKATVPAGHSSPCIWGDRIFLTGFADGKNVVIALDRNSGATLWERTFEGETHPQYHHVDAVPALPTPCTDGERLVAYLGDYGLVALDHDGNPLWERRMPHPGYGFGVGTSPILSGDNVILMRDGAPEAAVLAIDLASGEEAWKIDRFDYGESHGTPFLWQNADRDELVISGTRRLCSYDASTGDPLWSVDGTTVFPCTTATGDADTVYFAAWSTPNATGRSFWDATFGRSMDLSDAEIEDPKLLFERLDADHDGHVTASEIPECRAKDAFGFVDGNQNGMWEAEEFEAVSKPSGAPGKNIMVAVERGGEGDVSESHVRWTWTRGL